MSVLNPLSYQGPVVQSIVSLTSLLKDQLVKCFTTLFPNTLIFFVEKMREAFALQKPLIFFQQMREAFALQKPLTFFQQKYWCI